VCERKRERVKERNYNKRQRRKGRGREGQKDCAFYQLPKRHYRSEQVKFNALPLPGHTDPFQLWFSGNFQSEPQFFYFLFLTIFSIMKNL
jgi:hypothetical protein